MKLKYYILFCVLVLSCKDKYNSSFKQPPTGFLVVEGFINSGEDTTKIKLSRTSGLDTLRIIPEKNAVVTVESEGGMNFSLVEKGEGIYSIGPIPINPAQKYRVHIRTNDGKEYESAFESVKYSPPIDSVSWAAESDHVSVFVSTHDDKDSSRYYEWTYTEAWAYQAPYISHYYYVPHGFPLRDGNEVGKYQTCYLSSFSNDIKIGSSAKLSKDVISRFPIADIPYTTTNRLLIRYSMEVLQRVLSKEAYEWEEKLKKNTENLGSIFDPLPTQTGGNLHCISDPGTPVIGFVCCTSQTTKRIFTLRSELPSVRISNGYELCKKDTLLDGISKEDSIRNADYYASGDNVPLDYIYDSQGTGFSVGAPNSCVDCRLRGGTIDKPEFW